MDRFRRCPSPEQHVNPNTQVDQGDKPQILIEGTVFGLQNYLDIQGGSAVQIDRLRNRPANGIVRMRPDAAAKHLTPQRGNARSRLLIDAQQNVSRSYSCTMSGGSQWNPFPLQAAIRFTPPDTIGRNFQPI